MIPPDDRRTERVVAVRTENGSTASDPRLTLIAALAARSLVIDADAVQATSSGEAGPRIIVIWLPNRAALALSVAYARSKPRVPGRQSEAERPFSGIADTVRINDALTAELEEVLPAHQANELKHQVG